MTALKAALPGSGAALLEGMYLEDYHDVINMLEVCGRSDAIGMWGQTVPREAWVRDEPAQAGGSDAELAALRSFEALM